MIIVFLNRRLVSFTSLVGQPSLPLWLFLFLLLLHFPLFASFLLSLLILSIKVQDGPVKYEVILVAFSEEEVFEHPLQIGVVRPVFKSQRPAVVHISAELRRHVFTQKLYRRRHLLLHYFFIFFFF